MITSLNNLEFRELNAANDILVVMLDSLGRIIFFNKACEQATGYTFKEVVNRKLWEFLPQPRKLNRSGTVCWILMLNAFPTGSPTTW